MTRFGRSRLPLEDRSLLDAALTEAFAPLRLRTANIGPARVRAAVRWSRPAGARLRGVALLALLARISELSVAAAVSALLFGSTLAAVSSAPTPPGASRDAVTAGKWELNGRLAFQPPLDSRATAGGVTAGDTAVNAAIVRRDASRTDRVAVPPEQPSFEQ